MTPATAHREFLSSGKEKSIVSLPLLDGGLPESRDYSVLFVLVSIFGAGHTTTA